MTRGISRCARNRRRLISCHKAGHAVVAHKLGLENADITMIAGDDYYAGARPQSADL